MLHVPDLIQDLAIILVTAAVVTLIFKKLKQPVVLGYLIAGFLVGPSFPFFPSIKDIDNIKVWAEIGVIFMLFGLGLEFSFKKLKQVGKAASITASFEILSMLALGYITGQVLGWSRMDSLFLGGILSISSTTIIARAFSELGVKGKQFVNLVFGVLIVEDLIAVVLLVLLSSVAVTQSLTGSELLFSSLRLGFFLVLWFLLGMYLLPTVLHRIRDYLSDETMLIISISLCFLMVLIASSLGFSPALGAFVMGSLFAETREGQRIEHLIVPVRDLFSAIFFVSVGMMIHVDVLEDYFGVIILITVLTIVGKFISTTLGALISGRSLKNSVQAGLSLAQIGEFSFIIATLGLTLKVTSEFLYPIAVAVSAITTFSTPYMIKYTDPIYDWLEKKIPANVKTSFLRYEAVMVSTPGTNIVSLIWQEYGIKIFLNSVIIVAVTLSVKEFILPLIERKYEAFILIEYAICMGTLILVSPFIWAILFGNPYKPKSHKKEEISKLQRLQFGILLFRFVVGCLLIAFIISQFTSILAYSGVFLVGTIVLGLLIFSRFSEPVYRRIEKQLLSNLTENDRAELERRKKVPELAPWDATLAEFQISPRSNVVAKNLQQARLKEDFGVTVAMIQRGGMQILAPKHNELLLPYDRIFLIGNDEQLSQVKDIIEVPFEEENSKPISHSIGLTSIVLTEPNIFINKSIRTCGIREAVDGLIVGVERKGKRILSPDTSLVLEADDLLWVVGDLEKIRTLDNSYF